MAPAEGGTGVAMGDFMTLRLSLALFVLFACDSSSSGPAGGGDGDGAPPGGDGAPGSADASSSDDAGGGGLELGTVSEIDEPCPDGAGLLPGTRCRLVEVACPGIPALRAQVRITTPASTDPASGTILFGTGGGGESWYERAPAARAMLRALAEDGFQVVQRAWLEQWESGGAGLAAASCRYATLLTWVADEVGGDGAVCATGNSGGSAEIAYALSRWDREQVLDLAVPTGGPVMSRVDLGCLGGDEWAAECRQLPDGTSCEPAGVQCAYQGSNFEHIDGAYLPETPCELHDQAFADTLLADSILSPDADLDFGATPVHQLFGERDCSIALPQGVLWYDAVTSQKAQTFVPETGHGTPGTVEGAAAIRRVLAEECVTR
jgi:hypothetical protein